MVALPEMSGTRVGIGDGWVLECPIPAFHNGHHHYQDSRLSQDSMDLPKGFGVVDMFEDMATDDRPEGRVGGFNGFDVESEISRRADVNCLVVREVRSEMLLQARFRGEMTDGTH